MLRRVFLLQILLGWFLAVIEKVIAPHTNTVMASSLFSGAESIIFYVDPQGNDSWSGKRAIPNSEGNDGPFATLEGAKQAIEKLTTLQSNLRRPIKVMLKGGNHFLTQPLIFKPEDSGQREQPITYQSYPQENAIISGGRKITGWNRETIDNLKLWTVDLPSDLGIKWQFQHLWVNGTRRSRSRYPNEGYLQIKKAESRPQQKWSVGNYRLEYRRGDLADLSPKAFKDAELVVMNRWTESRLPIAKIDTAKRQIQCEKASVFQLEPGDYYYLENSRDFLTTPGEWYLDRPQSKLYYFPLPEEELDTTEIIAPILDSLIILKGNAEKNNYVQYLKFQNLTFSHTDWHLPPNISGYNQNASGVSGAIAATATQDCVWHSCTFSHLGNYALELKDDCQYNRISSCLFFDLGGGGIKVGNQYLKVATLDSGRGVYRNFIVGNHLYDGGKFFHSAAGIAVFKSHHNLIARNHVHDYYYTGITVMGTWNFKPTQAYQNLIEYNHIHHIGKLSNGDGPIMSDMGGIYILGRQKGTQVRHNKVHHVSALRYGGWGIYLDAGSSYITVEHNLVHHTSHGGFSQQYGKENLIRYNIFALGEKAQIQRHKKDLKFAQEKDFISFYFTHNIVYWRSGKFLSGIQKDTQSRAVFERNIYWQVDKSDFLLGGLPWEEWQKSDRHSQIADPLFVAPEAGDFQLQPNSPALPWQ